MKSAVGGTLDESASSGAALEQLYDALLATAFAMHQQQPAAVAAPLRHHHHPPPPPTLAVAVRLPRSVYAQVASYIRRHFAPPSWQTNIGDDASEREACGGGGGGGGGFIESVDEFKILVWESTAACFPNDHTLALAIRTLTRQPDLLTRLMQSRMEGGNTDHPVKAMGGSEGGVAAKHPSYREMATSPTPPSGTTPLAPPHTPFGTGPFGATPTMVDFLSSFRSDSHEMASSVPGAGAPSLAARGGLGNSVSSRRRPPLSTSPNPSGRPRTPAAPTKRFVPSRRIILVSLLMLVMVSLFTSVKLWDHSHTQIVYGPPRHSVIVGNYVRELDEHGHLVPTPELKKLVTPAPTTNGPSLPVPAVTAATNGPPLRVPAVVVAAKPRSSLDRPRSSLDRPPPPPHTQHPVKPVPPTEPPSAHPFCGSDSARHASGLPGTSSEAVDSIVAVVFDLTDEEQENANEFGAAYVLELIAKANTADPASLASPYHTFFRHRNVSLEVADIQDEAVEALERVGKSGPLRTVNETRRAPQCRGVVPFKMDVVYTYVNPQSPSHRTSITACAKGRHHTECSDARFRDYGELRYSMRSVFNRAMCHTRVHVDATSSPSVTSGGDGRAEPTKQGTVARVPSTPTNRTHSESLATAASKLSPPSSSSAPTSKCSDDGTSFVDKVHVIVAHSDQIPTWMNQSDTHIRVVTHKMIFPVEDHSTALPTFNSYAIESVMHRVPGLSRFFAYFNNDMLWGRPLSFFDYFRPLSTARQAFRLRTSPEAQCFASHYAAKGGTMPNGLQHPGGTTGGAPQKWGKRTVVFFEPIYYFEKLDQVLDRELLSKRHQPLIPGVQRAPLDLNLTSSAAALCENVPLKASAVVTLRMKTPTAFNVLHKTTNFNRNVLFEHYGMPPSHGFAHYPTIVDRDVLRRMQEAEIPGLNAQTRRARFREPSNIWTTYVYPYVALAHRRAIDKDLAIEAGLWQRNASVAQPANISAVGPLMDPSFGTLPDAVQGNMWLSAGNFDNEMSKKDHQLAKEKLRNWLVAMDGKEEPIYHFCMMTSSLVLQRYLRELQHKMKLFVTLNDDLKLVNANSLNLVHQLLNLVSANQPKAKWELS